MGEVKKQMPLVGLLAMLCGLLSPAIGQAAPQGPWVLPPADLSVPGGSAGQQQIAVGPDGTTTVVWQQADGPDRLIQSRTRTPGGSFGPVEDLTSNEEPAYNPQIAFGTDGTTAVAWLRFDGLNNIAQARVRPPGGSFESVQNLSAPGQDAKDVQIAVGPDGTVAAVWQRLDGYEIIQTSTRPPEGSFSPAMNLSASGKDSYQPRVAIGSDGTAAAIWRREDALLDYIIQARIRPPGEAFAPVANLSAGGFSASEPAISVGPDGTATAIWKRSDGSNVIIQSRTRPPGGPAGPVVDLSAPLGDAAEPGIAVGPDGTTTVVWRRTDPDNNKVVQTRTRPAGGSFATAENLTAADTSGFNPQVAIGADGTETVIWTGTDVSWSLAQARTRVPGGSYGPISKLSEPGQDANVPQVVVDPDGVATAVWRRNSVIQTASTELPRFTLDVTREGNGTGTVTSTPTGIDCGSDCTEDFTSYTNVTLTATPDAGSSFTGWAGSCEGAAGTTCELEMTQAAAATATFTADPPPPVVCPAKKLKTGKLKRNGKKGTARLSVTAGGKGKVILKGSKKVRPSSKKVGSSGKGRLTVKARGKAAKTLRKKGKVRLQLRLVYRPGGDCPNKTRTKKVRLVRK